jgi:hypothetical protein
MSLFGSADLLNSVRLVNEIVLYKGKYVEIS